MIDFLRTNQDRKARMFCKINKLEDEPYSIQITFTKLHMLSSVTSIKTHVVMGLKVELKKEYNITMKDIEVL